VSLGTQQIEAAAAPFVFSCYRSSACAAMRKSEPALHVTVLVDTQIVMNVVKTNFIPHDGVWIAVKSVRKDRLSAVYLHFFMEIILENFCLSICFLKHRISGRKRTISTLLTYRHATWPFSL